MNSLIVVANDVQDEEFTYPYYRLQEEGDVRVCTINGQAFKGKSGTTYVPEKWDGGLGHSRYLTPPLEINYFDCLIIPGGWCPEILRMNKSVLDLVRNFIDSGKVVGAICHGPQVLISANVLRGRKCTGYVGISDDLTNAGGVYCTTGVVTDGNIITAAHYKNNPQFVKAVIEAVKVNQTLAQHVVH